MGTWEGHAIPSVIYSFLSLWWGFVTIVKYIRSQRHSQSKFQTSSIQPCFCCPTKKLRLMPIESFFKLTFLSIHVYMELITGVYKVKPEGREEQYTLGLENAHHICMLSGFIIQALIEVLIYYGVPFPKGVEMFFAWIGFLIQALIMTNHKEENGIEKEVHRLWTIIIVCTFLAGTVEIYLQNHFWPACTRILFFLTQGTWMMQIAFVVWPHTTNPRFLWPDDHSSHVWLSISLMYHLVGNALLLMIEYVLVYSFMHVFDRCYEKYEKDVASVRIVIGNGVDEKRLRMRDAGDTAEGNAKEYAFLINEDDEP